jgi:cysteine desulfurase
MARALELAVAQRSRAAADTAALRDRLEAEIRLRVAGVTVNGGDAPRLANCSSLSFAGVDPAALIIALDLAGVSASAGSACMSGTLEPSHVLAAMSWEGDGPPSGVRFSLGTATTPAEIERVLGILPTVVADLRAFGPPVTIAGGMGRLETNRAPLEAGA